MSLLEHLDLRAAADADALESGGRTFTAVHVGQHDVRIGTVLDLIRADDDLLPPRTGHLGNWEDIAAGTAGPMDFNTAICGGGYGYPLIYGFTRTEADTPGGDEAYQPGSLIRDGRRRRLALHTWDGTRFAPRDAARPLFCPLVQAEVDGDLVPLVELHWERMRAAADYPFTQWAHALTARADLVTDMLTLLLERAGSQGRAKAFAELVSQSVSLDGEVGRCDLRPDGSGFVLDGHRYGSARELAEAAMLTVRALVEPRAFFADIAQAPPVLPVMALPVTNVLFGALGMHRRAGRQGRPTGEEPVVEHLHWGARSMAGCPPRRNGYLVRRSTVRSLRAVSDPLVAHFEEVRPLAFVLLPAQVFALCPPASRPGDVERMAGLVGAVRSARPDDAHATARAWLADHVDGFSGYTRDRFREGAGVPGDGRTREPSEPTHPEGFADLTFRQACATVAAFEEAVS